jgi:hypothetical protein
MAFTNGKGKPNVVKAAIPTAGAAPKAMANAHVGRSARPVISSGKMAGGTVSLGTFHGKHNVAHPL